MFLFWPPYWSKVLLLCKHGHLILRRMVYFAPPPNTIKVTLTKRWHIKIYLEGENHDWSESQGFENQVIYISCCGNRPASSPPWACSRTWPRWRPSESSKCCDFHLVCSGHEDVPCWWPFLVMNKTSNKTRRFKGRTIGGCAATTGTFPSSWSPPTGTNMITYFFEEGHQTECCRLYRRHGLGGPHNTSWRPPSRPGLRRCPGWRWHSAAPATPINHRINLLLNHFTKSFSWLYCLLYERWRRC